MVNLDIDLCWGRRIRINWSRVRIRYLVFVYSSMWKPHVLDVTDLPTDKMNYRNSFPTWNIVKVFKLNPSYFDRVTDSVGNSIKILTFQFRAYILKKEKLKQFLPWKIIWLSFEGKFIENVGKRVLSECFFLDIVNEYKHLCFE